MIQNWPINASEVTDAHAIFGPRLDGSMVNTAQHNPYSMVMDFVDVPKVFLKLHHFVTIMADLMFVNVAPFLVTISHGMKFVAVKHIPIRMDNQLSKYLKVVMKINSRSSMVVQTFLVGINFNKTIYYLV